MSNEAKAVKVSGFQKFLNAVEVVGNKLPSPFTLFVILSGIVVIFAQIFDGVAVQIPGSGEQVLVVGLLSVEGIRWFIKNILANFVAFPPFKTVLVTMLGVAVCDQTGFFEVLAKRALLKVPPYFVTIMIAFMGIMSNLASDAGCIFMPTLGAAIFAVVGRSPIVGMSLGYATSASGYFANLMITPHDASLSAITLAAMDAIPATANAPMNVTSNWFMAIASTFVLLPVAVLVTNKVIEPKFGSLEGLDLKVQTADRSITERQQKALNWSGLAFLVYIILLAVLAIPKDGLLRDAKSGASMLTQMDPVVPIIGFGFFLVGGVYGFVSGLFKSEKDLVAAMTAGMKSMGGFLVIAFAASQLIGIFKYTNLSTVMAVRGADLLNTSGISGTPLIILYILGLAFINLFLYSGTSKWSLLAPVFVPMFGLLGFSPAFTLGLYRIADSCTNIISPLWPYLPIVLGLTVQYKKDAGIGTIMSMMLPYSLAFTVAWIVMAIVWYLLGIPVGPGVPAML